MLLDTLDADDFCGTGGVASEELEAGCDAGGRGPDGTCGRVCAIPCVWTETELDERTEYCTMDPATGCSGHERNSPACKRSQQMLREVQLAKSPFVVVHVYAIHCIPTNRSVICSNWQPTHRMLYQGWRVIYVDMDFLTHSGLLHARSCAP
jgi:hypothetical protein